MRLKLLSVLLFFATVIAVALLLFPTRMDMVILYRNSYFYDKALELLDEQEEKHPEDRRIYLERARTFYLTGRYEQAVDILQGYTSTHPDDPEGWRVLAQNNLVLQRRGRAAAAYEHLLASAPGDPEAFDWLEIHYRLNQQGERRAENLEQLLASVPDNFYVHEKLIDLYMRMGRPDDARQAIERAARTFPDSAYIQEQLGQFYLSQRDAQALSIFAALHEEYPDEEAYLSGLVNALILAEQGEEALARFQEFYRPRLGEAEYYQRLGLLHTYLSDTERALEAFEKQLAIDPSVDTRLQVINLLAGTEQYDLALAQVRLLVEETPDWPEFWKIYVDYLAAAENKHELIDVLERYTKRWPEDLRMWEALTDAYEWIDDSGAALPVARRLFRLEPGRAEHRERLARLLLARDHHRDAAHHYARLLRRRPGSETSRLGLLFAVESIPPDTVALVYARQLYQAAGPEPAEVALLLGRLYEIHDQPDRAERVYATLNRAYPDSAAVSRRIGQQLLDADHLETARGYFLRTLELAPDDTVALSGLAVIAYEQNPPAALPYLQNLERRDPGDIETLYRLGLVYEALDDTTRMIDYYQRMLGRIRDLQRDDLLFMRQKAHALFRTGSPSPARQLLDQARQQYPKALELANDYAEILIAQRQYGRALEVLSEVPGL